MSAVDPGALNRRDFLGSSARNAAGVAAGVVGLTSAARARAMAVERMTVGVIGLRGYGRVLTEALLRLPEVDVVALCDVDSSIPGPLAQLVAASTGRQPIVETDFRRLLENRALDAVVIATPEHWLATQTVAACRAGKDVYVESPLAHSLGETDAVLAAVRESRRIVQVGLQQRSGEHFRSAVAYVQSGALGNVRLAKAWTTHQRKSIGRRSETDVPSGVDYNAWLGPAAERAFQPNRFHHHWRWFWEYGSGELGNWGVHLLDVARWGLGAEMPWQVAAAGGKFVFQDDQETPDTLQVTYSYPDRQIVWEHRQWSPHAQEGRSAATAFYGDRGTLVVDRGGWKVYGQKGAAGEPASELLTAHLQNWIECIRTRSTPNADVAAVAASTALCHLGNIAYRLERSVSFDPVARRFVRDSAAQTLYSAHCRAPWGVTG